MSGSHSRQIFPRTSDSGRRPAPAPLPPIALKFVGIPLKQIQLLLDRNPLSLGEALRAQLRLLESRRERRAA